MSDLVTRLEAENAALRAEIAALRALSYEDALTGLKNRRAFDERLAAEVARVTRDGKALSVMICDIDDFKRINDVHGHAVGDIALRWAGGLLSSLVRAEDLVCRIGGDEFAVILPGADELGCRRMVRRLRRRLDVQAGRHTEPLSLSVGTATFSQALNDAEALVTEADLAMYRDKVRRRTGRVRRPSMA